MLLVPARGGHLGGAAAHLAGGEPALLHPPRQAGLGAFTLSITATPGEATGSYVPAAMSTCTSLRANGGGTATTSTHAAPSGEVS
ncbi:MAG: hypothetical protein ACJ8GN_19445 [Longimicrobiaceae bacterium]